MQVKDNGKVLIFENRVQMTVDGSVISGNKAP
jgi:lipopolysaccharide export system protein LptC